jgi:hypothetical protein
MSRGRKKKERKRGKKKREERRRRKKGENCIAKRSGGAKRYGIIRGAKKGMATEDNENAASPILEHIQIRTGKTVVLKVCTSKLTEGVQTDRGTRNLTFCFVAPAQLCVWHRTADKYSHPKFPGTRGRCHVFRGVG